MPACLCCGHGAAQPVMLHDLTPGSADIASESHCAGCRRKEGAYCERHQTTHICANDTSTELEDMPRLMSSCPVCALETTLRLSHQARWGIALALTPSGDTETFLEMARKLGLGWMPLLNELEQVVCAVAITAAWYDMTLDAFVEEILA